MKSRRQHHEDLFGERPEIRAKVNGALQRKNFFVFGFYPEMTERCLVMRLHALSADHHAHAAERQ